MKLAAVLVPAACRLAYTESASMKSKSEFAKMMANFRSFFKRLLSVPNLDKPAP